MSRVADRSRARRPVPRDRGRSPRRGRSAEAGKRARDDSLGDDAVSADRVKRSVQQTEDAVRDAVKQALSVASADRAKRRRLKELRQQHTERAGKLQRDREARAEEVAALNEAVQRMEAEVDEAQQQEEACKKNCREQEEALRRVREEHKAEVLGREAMRRTERQRLTQETEQVQRRLADAKLGVDSRLHHVVQAAAQSASTAYRRKALLGFARLCVKESRLLSEAELLLGGSGGEHDEDQLKRLEEAAAWRPADWQQPKVPQEWQALEDKREAALPTEEDRRRSPHRRSPERRYSGRDAGPVRRWEPPRRDRDSRVRRRTPSPPRYSRRR